ncbi:hypothetical protein ACP3V3_16740 [Vibrio sp. PNB22_3_1]
MTNKAERSRYLSIHLNGANSRLFQVSFDRLMRELQSGSRAKLNVMNSAAEQAVEVSLMVGEGAPGFFRMRYTADWPLLGYKQTYTEEQTEPFTEGRVLRRLVDKVYDTYVSLSGDKSKCADLITNEEMLRKQLENGRIEGRGPKPERDSIFDGYLQFNHVSMVSNAAVLDFVRTYEPATSADVFALRFLLCYSIEDMSRLCGIDTSMMLRIERVGYLPSKYVSIVRGGVMRYPDLHHLVFLAQAYLTPEWVARLFGLNNKALPKSFRPSCLTCHSRLVEIKPDDKYMFFVRCLDCGEIRRTRKMPEIRYYLLHELRVQVDLLKPQYHASKDFQKYVTVLRRTTEDSEMPSEQDNTPT